MPGISQAAPDYTTPDYTTDANLVAAGYAAINSGDFAAAAKDFSTAAIAGNAQAELHLGLMYLTGKGEPQNCQKAINWIMPSARQGDPQAIYNVGVFYLHGICLPKNYTAAMQLFKADGQAGWAEAQVNVGVMYDYGMGVPQDDVKAIKWFTLAANQNNAMAQLNLGLLAQTGRGEARNMVQADMWMELACKNASNPVFKRLSEAKLNALQAEMTSEQIAQGDGLAASWKPAAKHERNP